VRKNFILAKMPYFSPREMAWFLLFHNSPNMSRVYCMPSHRVSEEDRLRKAGFASFATVRDSTKLNVTQRVLNKHDYPDHIYDEADARFVPVLLTNNGCSFCEGFLINLLWNRYYHSSNWRVPCWN
jgi:hypothetical protein